MSTWLVLIALPLIIAFAMFMAHSEMRHRGYFRTRRRTSSVHRRMAREQARELVIIAKLETAGFSADEIAYAIASDTEPEVVPMLVLPRRFYLVGEMPILGLRVRAMSLSKLEDAARSAVPRARDTPLSDVVIDITELEPRP